MTRHICSAYKFPLVLFCSVLTACGGGGGGGGSSSSTSVSITELQPKGFVVPQTSRTVILTGTNLANGMTITATDSNGNNYAGTATYNASLGNLSVPVTISTAPTDRYLTVTLKSSTGTVLATEALGVASVSKTLASDVFPIFNNNVCYSCHTSVSNIPDMSSSSLAASTLINTSSTKCSGKYRVKAGDPRRSSNVLLDVLYAKTTTPVMSCNSVTSTRAMPQGSGAALTQTELDTITEWIAGGAN